jgi:hypothetical protein
MTDKSAAAARELVERWMGKKHPITMQSYVSDLTALISEHYVSREEYDEEKKSNSLLHKAMVTAEKGGHDKAMEEISEHYYPKEFVSWLLNGYTFLKRDQSFVVNYPYLTEHNDYRHFTTDELFNYWKENERC